MDPHNAKDIQRIFGVMAIRSMASHALSTSLVFCAFLSYFCLDFVLPRSQRSQLSTLRFEALIWTP